MSSHDRPFATTHWSMVLAAGQSEGRQSRQALEQLCATYWYPIYAYVRRRGIEATQAQDLTQEFFLQLLEKGTIGVADRERGRFRTFLLSAMQNFLANQWRAQQALKRGGGQTVFSLDFARGEAQFRHEPVDRLSPEKIFERRWAMTLLARSMDRLREDYVQSGKAELFDAIKLYLGGSEDRLPYRELSEKLSMSEGAIKVAAHRLRRRCGEVLREEISQTVADPQDIEEELRQLFTALSLEG